MEAGHSVPKSQPTVKSFAKTAAKGFNVHVNDKYYAAAFLGPSLLILGVFVFYPMVRTLYLSLFLTNNVGRPTVFVGLKNYVSLLTSAAYRASLTATGFYVVGGRRFDPRARYLAGASDRSKAGRDSVVPDHLFGDDGGLGLGRSHFLAVHL